MRVAYVCADPGVPVFGRKGCSIHVQEVVRALVGRGAEVTLFATRVEGERPADLDAVTVRALPHLPKGEPHARAQAALASNHALRDALYREGPFDLVYERYSLWSYAGMEYAREAGAPGLLEVNAPLIEEEAAYRELVMRGSAEMVARRAFGAAGALLAVSTEVARYLERYVPHGRIHVVPNGVNPSRFPDGLEPALPGEPGSFTVGFVGTLKPWHGLPILVEAFGLLHQQAPLSRLLIVGDGTERERLEDDLTQRGLLDCSILTGMVDPGDIPCLLASMDVAVAPYPDRRDFYFSPLKVFEYMAAGLPVVASRIGQLTDIIDDGVTGLLCQPGDVRELAQMLDRLQRDSQLRTRIGASARHAVLRQQTWQVVAERILEVAGREDSALKLAG